METSAVYQVKRAKCAIVVFQLPGGAPMAGALLEEVIALGCREFFICGSSGAIDPSLRSGSLVIPTAAVRDEGTSLHYLRAGRETTASLELVQVLSAELHRRRLQHRLGKAWTTDAVYRETTRRKRLRQREGCLVVDMEASALFAIAKFRLVRLAYLLYAGDSIAGDIWEERGFRSKRSIRTTMLECCLAAAAARQQEPQQ